MKILTAFVVSLFICGGSTSSCQTVGSICKPSSSFASDEARKILKTFQPSTVDILERRCIAKSIELLAATKNNSDIPLLIPYLGFKRPPGENETPGFSLHLGVPVVLYPAIGALALQGEPANELVSLRIEASDTTQLQRQNAVTTLLIIGHGHPELVLSRLLQRHKAVDAAVQKRLDDAIEFGLKSGDCKHSNGKCEDTVRSARVGDKVFTGDFQGDPMAPI